MRQRREPYREVSGVDAMSKSGRNLTIDISAMFWGVVFLSCAATGNCGMCGLGRDYVGDYIDGRCEP